MTITLGDNGVRSLEIFLISTKFAYVFYVKSNQTGNTERQVLGHKIKTGWVE